MEICVKANSSPFSSKVFLSQISFNTHLYFPDRSLNSQNFIICYMEASYFSRTYIDISQQIQRDYLLMISQCLHVNHQDVPPLYEETIEYFLVSSDVR